MAWWQMLSISLVSGLGVGSLFGIGWWFWKRALRDLAAPRDAPVELFGVVSRVAGGVPNTGSPCGS